ncbi:MAG TPA: nucleotidyltransferase domain-containing protein [Alicyclobacillus sp.]|nr:nucleotidyltransferase domain-containing protein [Alicyclobacillus sp.]
MKFFGPRHRTYVRLVLERVQKYYADRLLAFAMYGSYARRENRMNSDLDLLIVLREGKRRRYGSRRSSFFGNTALIPTWSGKLRKWWNCC